MVLYDVENAGETAEKRPVTVRHQGFFTVKASPLCPYCQSPQGHDEREAADLVVLALRDLRSGLAPRWSSSTG